MLMHVPETFIIYGKSYHAVTVMFLC